MPAQEFYVEGVIQINITICKSWWKVLFVSSAEIPAKRVCPYTFKVPGLHGSQGILISHLIGRDLMIIKASAQFSGHSLGSQLFPGLKCGCFSDWVEMSKEIIMGMLNLELAGKHWGALGAVHHQARCCMTDNSTLGHTAITGSFLNHRHLISLQLIDSNGVYSFNFYTGVRESRAWLEATIVLCWQMEWVKCAESNPL